MGGGIGDLVRWPGGTDVEPANCLYVFEDLVALTGIEWVKRQFSPVQSRLSLFFSIQSVLHRHQRCPYRSLWCDPRVTAEYDLLCRCLPEVW